MESSSNMKYLQNLEAGIRWNEDLQEYLLEYLLMSG
jgi:hypothetical protein